jgi:hypothetical protein
MLPIWVQIILVKNLGQCRSRGQGDVWACGQPLGCSSCRLNTMVCRPSAGFVYEIYLVGVVFLTSPYMLSVIL